MNDTAFAAEVAALVRTARPKSLFSQVVVDSGPDEPAEVIPIPLFPPAAEGSAESDD